MARSGARPVYHRLVVVATRPETDIWLADDLGHLVQKEVGTLTTSLLPGDYVVEFGLGTTTYPIHLAGDLHHTQAELEAGPSCPRPIPQLLDADDEDTEAVD